MNWSQIASRWGEVRTKVLEQWDKLSMEDLDTIAGKRDQLIGVLQRRYGATREAIEAQVKEFEQRLTDRQPHAKPV